MNNSELILQEKADQKNQQLAKISKAFVAVGFAVLLFCCISFLHIRHLKASLATATGTITDVHQYRKKSGRIRLDHPTVRFIDAAGVEHKFTSNYSSDFSNYYVGRSIPVLYNPAKPTKAYINDYTVLWSDTLGLCFIPAFCFMVGYFASRKLKPEDIKEEELQKTETQTETLKRQLPEKWKSYQFVKDYLVVSADMEKENKFSPSKPEGARLLRLFKRGVILFFIVSILFPLLTTCGLSIRF